MKNYTRKTLGEYTTYTRKTFGGNTCQVMKAKPYGEYLAEVFWSEPDIDEPSPPTYRATFGSLNEALNALDRF